MDVHSLPAFSFLSQLKFYLTSHHLILMDLVSHAMGLVTERLLFSHHLEVRPTMITRLMVGHHIQIL